LIAALAALLYLAEAVASPPPTAGDAEALFREGLKAYDAKQFRRAIESFEGAYRLSPLPEILFDIAMARRALGDCPRAADAFDAFIAAAPAGDPLLARARARRAELGSCAAATAVAAPPKAAGESAAVVAPLALRGSNAPAPSMLIAPIPTPPRRERSWIHNTCVGAVTGTALLGAGVLVFGWQARSAQADSENAAVWDAAAVRADERAHAYGQVATTLLISAGFSTAIAAASCIVMSRSGSAR
jgi:tetratricopeptide (TPR) repeat protein